MLLKKKQLQIIAMLSRKVLQADPLLQKLIPDYQLPSLPLPVSHMI